MEEQIQNIEPSNESVPQVEELSFIDKVTGIFTEPSKVFENVKIYGPKTIDWLLPIVLLIVMVILTNFIVMSNPDIKAEIVAKSREATESALDKAVKEGRMTEAQKEEQLEQIEKFTSSPVMMIVQYISIAVFMFLFMFIISGIYHLIWVFLFKGQGSYTHSLSVYGLSSFISLVEVIIVAVISLLMVKFLTGFHLASFVNVEKGTTLSYVFSKINPFTFWWLYVIGIGLSKVYSVEKSKSLITIFALWVIYVVIGKFIPFLSFGA